LPILLGKLWNERKKRTMNSWWTCDAISMEKGIIMLENCNCNNKKKILILGLFVFIDTI
jgi:hypothetical protein